LEGKESLMGRMEGKATIVTGGALGIGRATCELLAREGAKVAIVDLLDEEAKELADRIGRAGGAARYWRADVARESDIKRVVAEIGEAFGRIDALVNNAGISGANKPTHELSEEEWDRVQAVNVKGVFFCTKHVVPWMLRAGGGSIVNLSSIYGLVGAADAPPYHASKGAVRLMSKTDALLYAKQGIRVNSVHPGFIWTPMVEKFLRTQGDVEKLRRALDALHPVGRVGEPEEVAYGILYLACDESKFVTGSELVIDGGYTAR
jgi:NAD(P)-dependent dehydrogenase (short-subunit alcohol dehydrogenase family)